MRSERVSPGIDFQARYDPPARIPFTGTPGGVALPMHQAAERIGSLKQRVPKAQPGGNAATQTPMPSVLIIQEHMPAFRVGFYEILRGKLAARGVKLDLIYAPNQRNTFVTAEVDWAIKVPIHWLGGKVGWQPVLGHCRGRDLVIVQQETKYLVNPVLQLWRKFGGPRVAYWGHGKNFQARDPDSRGERVKSFMARHVDWWFAYNRLSAEAVRATGFPAERITEVMNAIDTRLIRETRANTSPDELAALRKSLLIDSDHVAVYTGGLYPLKRIDFLLEAAMRIRKLVPDFHLIVIGKGPDEGKVRDASNHFPWIHAVGPKNDTEKVPYWMISKLLLMPGGVGLVALDALALGVPMVTTRNRLHGPEIDYLRHERNGWMVDDGDDVQAYADAVAGLLQDHPRLSMLSHNAEEDGAQYSFEKMATNFADGVMQCLGR
jgi:glycosyltransferase involved in cell wall biosynthesis